MNTQKVFSKVIKANSEGKDVSVITNYTNSTELLKYILSMPNTHIVSIDIADELWDNYYDPYLIDLSANGDVYCQPVVFTDGQIAAGEGLYFIDVLAIGEYLPEDFVIKGENTKIKLIGGE